MKVGLLEKAPGTGNDLAYLMKMALDKVAFLPFGLVIDNALNFLNNPDGIQGHNFGTQLSHTESGLTLQGRLTLVRYNNEPQFFIADADVLLSVAADMLERLGEHLEPDMIDAELIGRLREGVELIERRTKSRT